MICFSLKTSMNQDHSIIYPMNSHQFSLVLLNIVAASSCFGLETIEFSRVLFLSCMSNQAIYLPPLKYGNSSIFMIEVCKKKFYFTLSSEINVYQKWIKVILILIFSLVIDISRYFHCRVWITSDVSIHLKSLNVPHFRNSNAYNSVIYE